MPSETTPDRADVQPTSPQATRNPAVAAFTSPFLWGGLLTVGFYQLIPHLPAGRALAERYFCGHPLEYATAALFFLGIAILGHKAIRSFREFAALDLGLLDDPALTEAGDPIQRARRLEAKLDDVPRAYAETAYVTRIRDLCAFVRGRASVAGLEEHLKYLADLAVERLQGSFALVRNITWAVPIIGFLGTVIGITMAIANVTPEQLDSSLGEVTSGLAVAFDTTALALTLSLVLVFASFLVERREQKILAEVEELGVKRIAVLFPADAGPQNPLAGAELQASQQLIEKTESLINWQAQVWQEGLDSLRRRWVETVEGQQNAFDQAVREGLQSTLEGHQRQLGEVRGEFLEAFRTVSRQLAESQDESRAAQQQLHEDLQRQTAELWQQARADFAALRDEQAGRIGELVSSLETSVAGWQSQLKESTEAGAAQFAELRRQGELLGKVVQKEEDLARLQQRLTENLEAVRAAESFDETLHSLSAAVHLLANRAKPKAA